MRRSPRFPKRSHSSALLAVLVSFAGCSDEREPVRSSTGFSGTLSEVGESDNEYEPPSEIRARNLDDLLDRAMPTDSSEREVAEDVVAEATAEVPETEAQAARDRGWNRPASRRTRMTSSMRSAPLRARRVSTQMITRLDEGFGGAPRAQGQREEVAPAPRPRRPRPSRMTPSADPGTSSGSLAAAPPRSNVPLPQNGVLASDFVSGNGVNARLDDLLSRGVMVGGENVRIGAFRDRDPLPYALPSRDGMAMHVNLERSRLNETRDEVHMQIALMGRRGEAPVRPKVDVRLVLDRSGSMTDNDKWQNAIGAAHQLVDHLSPNDTFGLITYSDEATIDVNPMRVGNRRAIHRVIDQVVPGGGTNIGSALDMVERHRPRARGRDVGLVILLSDGRATVGQTNARMLGDQARALFDQHGVLTTTIGLGNDFDENLMLSIAREGSGSYHFVRRPSDVAAIMTDELDDRIQAVAQGLRVQIKLKNGVIAEHVYGSRLLSESEHQAVRATEVAVDQRVARELGITRTRQREEQEGLRIHLPTFRRGDQHVILMRLSVPAGSGEVELAEVTLDYKDLIRNRNASVTQEASATRVSDQDTSVASTDRNVKRTVLAFQAGETLQSSADAFRRGARTEALRILTERQELLVTASRLWRDPGLARDAELLGNYQAVMRQTFDAQSTNTIVMAMNYFGDQRMR